MSQNIEVQPKPEIKVDDERRERLRQICAQLALEQMLIERDR